MKRYIFILMMTVIVSVANAQKYDIAFCEASIATHKSGWSYQMSRAILEAANDTLHNKVKVKTFNYKTLCDDLETYNKAFGWVEAIYTGLKTVYLVKTTYDNVKEKAVGIEKLLEEYNEKCIKQKRLSTSDTIIFSLGRTAGKQIIRDCEHIKDSYAELVMYASGMKCTTERLISILDNIDESMNVLGKDLDMLYFQLHKYIVSRTHMWKRNITMSKSKAEYAGEALARWRNSMRKGSGKIN